MSSASKVDEEHHVAEKTRILVLMERTVERRQISVLNVAEQFALLGTALSLRHVRRGGPKGIMFKLRPEG